MSDVFPRAKRSQVMARIRSKGNAATEVAFVRLLRAERITGWRRHLELPIGGSAPSRKKRPVVRPDFVFRELRLAVFIDGCFWHLCPRHASEPKTNSGFWSEKLRVNRARDRYVSRALRHRGWSVMRVWEHDLPNSQRVVSRLRRTVIELALERGPLGDDGKVSDARQK